MAVMDVMVPVSKETYEMGEALVDLIVKIKGALADGWQIGSDVPVMISAVVTNMAEIIEGMKAAKGEWDQDDAATVAALSLTVAALVKELRK